MEAVVLPLDDPGKADASKPSGRDGIRGSPWRRLLLAGALLGVGAVAGAYLLAPAMHALRGTGGLDPTASRRASNAEAADPAPDATALDIVALGRLRPDGGTLALALPSGAGDARIARLMVAEGDVVEAGETVAELDNMAMLVAARASAEAGLAAEQAALDQVRAAMVSSLAEARANHLAAGAALTLANEALARQKKLAASSSTTQVLVDQAAASLVRAQAEFDRTAALAGRFAGAETGDLADIVQAERKLDLARANLLRADEDLASARVVAPRAGTVLEIRARIGEKPSDTGVMTIGDIARMTAELEVYQTDIKEVAPGQTVSMTAPALPAVLAGRVTRIGRIVARQSVMSSEPAANADARVVIVTVALDAKSSALAGSYTNLEVAGRIRRTAR